MKLFKTTLLVAAAVGIVACNNDGNQYHELTNLTPGGGIRTLFADQTVDSMRIVSTDRFTVSSNAEWLKSSRSSIKVPDGWFSVDTVFAISAELNTTGKNRSGLISVVSSYENYTIGAGYTQLGVLNINRPAPQRDDENNYYFQQKDSAHVILDSLFFTTYGDWSLKLKEGEDASWCKLNEETVTGSAGEHVIYYELARNSSTSDRETAFVLTSNGVSTEIKLLQLKAVTQ